MRYPQLLIYESDGRLAALLRETARDRKWALREPRQPESCLDLLRGECPSVLVLKMGRSPERELTLLERVSWLFPTTATVVVTDTENAALAGLAWDLGACAVLVPPLPRDQLPDLVTGLMASVEV